MELEQNEGPQHERGRLMEEKSDASEADAADPDPSLEPSRAPTGHVCHASVTSLARSSHLRCRQSSTPAGLAIVFLSYVAVFGAIDVAPARGDALERVR